MGEGLTLERDKFATALEIETQVLYAQKTSRILVFTYR